MQQPTLFTDLFSVIHLGALACLVTMLFHPRLRGWFERRCVGDAGAEDLAWIRIITCAVILLYSFTEDLSSQALLDAGWYQWPGHLGMLKRGLLKYLMGDAGHLEMLVLAMRVTLVLAMVGVVTRVTVPLSFLFYVVYAGLLRSFGKYFHDGLISLYVLLALCFLPTHDRWSFDAWWRRRRGREDPTLASPRAYNWAVWACYAAACTPYLQLAFSKLVNGGLYWFAGGSLRNYMIVDDLNLTEFHFDLGLHGMGVPTLLWTIAGFFALATELTYPLVLVVPRLRRYLPIGVALLHLGVFLGQDALFLDAILMPLIFVRPLRLRASGLLPRRLARPL